MLLSMVRLLTQYDPLLVLLLLLLLFKFMVSNSLALIVLESNEIEATSHS